jgi:hypothetical protein
MRTAIATVTTPYFQVQDISWASPLRVAFAA